MTLTESEKLQKVLARAGVASRREAESLISEGRVTVNGQVATLGDRVVETDRIAVDGRSLHTTDRDDPVKLVIYNKPEGEVCTRSDPEGRPTVFRRLPKLRQGRWVGVGRLDIATTGLMLFTTDGELANRLMHPSSGIDREYVVRVWGDVDDDMLGRLREGVLLEDGMARFSDIKEGRGSKTHSWYHVTLMEGRNREVRRLWESQGVTVSRLKRVRFGSLFLPARIKMGQWEYLGVPEASALYQMVGLPVPVIYEPKKAREAASGSRRPATTTTRSGRGGSREGRAPRRSR